MLVRVYNCEIRMQFCSKLLSSRFICSDRLLLFPFASYRLDAPMPSSFPPLDRPRTAKGVVRTAFLNRIVQRPQTAAEVQPFLNREDEAKRRYVAAAAECHKVTASASKQLILAQRRARAVALREEYDEHTGKDLVAKLRDVQPATDEEVVDWAKKLNIAMCRKWPQEKGQSTYFKLFRFMDEDQSGLITLYELEKMTFELLHLSFPSATMARIWRWVDQLRLMTMDLAVKGTASRCEGHTISRTAPT